MNSLPPSTLARRRILVTGGARSGKSTFAEALLAKNSNVTYIATLAADDAEMKRRIEQHRARRPDTWTTLEIRRGLYEHLRVLRTDWVLVDCVGGWISNIIMDNEETGGEQADREVGAEVQALTEGLSSLPFSIVFVTNEVGNSVVPAYPLGRWFRDSLGHSNQRIAAAVDEVYLLTCGIPNRLK